MLPATLDDVIEDGTVMPDPPTCMECGAAAVLTDGREVYPHRPDLYTKPLWACRPCKASCGCHPGGYEPLGFPAGKATRQARMRLHEDRLDPIWKGRKGAKKKRGQVYRLLSARMGLPPERTHTGMFSIEQCREAWRVLEGVTPENVGTLVHEIEAGR